MTQKTTLILSVTALLVADPPDWNLSPPMFEYNMALTATISNSDEVQMHGSGDMFGAFVNDEIRGVRIGADFFPPTGNFLFLLQIYSNHDGEEITFKFYDESSDQVFDIIDYNLEFQADAIIGDAISPVELFILEEANNSAPVAQSSEYSLDEDNMITIYLSGTDAEGDALTFAINSAPNNGTVSLSGIAATYMPNANYNGMDNFTFIANDGQQNSNIAAITLTVNAINDAPYLLAIPDSEIEAGQPFVYSLSAVDVDGDDLTYSVLLNSEDGTATISDNVLTVIGNTPNSMLEIIVMVSDGITTDETSFMLMVLAEPCEEEYNQGFWEGAATGDVNGDGELNVVDLVLSVNMILDGE